MSPPILRGDAHRRAVVLIIASLVAALTTYGCDAEHIQSPAARVQHTTRPRPYIASSGAIDIPVPATSYPGDGAGALTSSGVVVPIGNRFIKWHLVSTPALSYSPECMTQIHAYPTGQIPPWGFGSQARGSTEIDLTSFPAGGQAQHLDMDLHPDPTGGWTSVTESGGGFIPAAFRTGLDQNDATCGVVDTTQVDPVTGGSVVHIYPKYLLSGSNRLEFQTVDINLTMDKHNVMMPDSIEISLTLDSSVPYDSITWHVTNFPKTPGVGAFHPECKNHDVCYIKPAVRGGEHANVKIWGFWGSVELKSAEFYGFSLCASDPPLAVDTLASSAEFRRTIKALMDSSWADSAANKRRERQVYFYRDSSDHSVPPRVQAYWAGTDSIAPLPCMSWFRPNNPGPEYVLLGWAHSHPFTQNEPQPSNCGPLHAGYGYQPGPSTWDWDSYTQRGGVTAYAVDKWAINRFRKAANGNNDEGYYPWNNLGCFWF